MAVNRPGREVYQPPPSSVGGVELYLRSPVCLHGVDGANLFLRAFNRCQNIAVGLVNRLRGTLFGVRITAGTMYIVLSETDLRATQSPNQWVSG